MAELTGSEQEMAREIAYSLASMCEEAEQLYKDCMEKVNSSEKARIVSQTDYINGVQQHPTSKRSFAALADEEERDLTAILRKLHRLSENGRSMWSDFLFLAGGPKSDFSSAIQWCVQHGIDSNTVITITAKWLFLTCDFGVTKESFLKEDDRIGELAKSMKQ